MPLEKYLPLIDARRYDEIVNELRARIPRYLPEWTDFNDSDPGMTLVQLFAWLADMLLYRMNKVPELNQIKFLQLLGIELRPAEPARAEITFPLQNTFTGSSQIIPARTQVSAESGDGGPPVIFETEKAFNALIAKLAVVRVFDRGSISALCSQSRARLLSLSGRRPPWITRWSSALSTRKRLSRPARILTLLSGPMPQQQGPLRAIAVLRRRKRIPQKTSPGNTWTRVNGGQ
jgi:predicted phage baseplate assembly protein